MLTQDNLCANINALSKAIYLGPDDNMLSFLPLHHTFESTATFLYGMASGVTVGFSDGLKYVVKNLGDYKVSVMICVPLMLDSMYKKLQKGIEDAGKANLIKTMTKVSNSFLKIGIDLRRVLFKSIINKLGGNLRLIVSRRCCNGSKNCKGFTIFWY